jgi:hypothetical protein
MPCDIPRQLVVLCRDSAERQLQLIGGLTHSQVRRGRQRHGEATGLVLGQMPALIGHALAAPDLSSFRKN